MSTPTKEEFSAAVHYLAGYATTHEKELLSDYDGTLGIRDASREILKAGFQRAETAEARVAELEAQNARLRAIWQCYQHYAELLENEIGTIMPFMHVHGWSSSRVQAGDEARVAIANAKDALAGTEAK